MSTLKWDFSYSFQSIKQQKRVSSSFKTLSFIHHSQTSVLFLPVLILEDSELNKCLKRKKKKAAIYLLALEQ